LRYFAQYFDAKNMDTIFLIIVILLMLLAVSDLIVGVANDAANFLNSAIGSKAAPRSIIMVVASVGIILGVLTSSGMMEIARSGVFHPNMFTFSDIMLLFLAVMLTDVILLDVFNTLRLPTSTTVSLVFELLGAAVCVSLFCISASPTANMGDLPQYINSHKALAIISGILISVVIAFICGSVIMFLTRLIFSFNYSSKIKSLGSIWCGFALTAITYFAVFKGLQEGSIIPLDTLDYINENIMVSLAATWLCWTIVMFLLSLIKVNILKITVLAGTFALALAFAGNDLVNFIGIFMAGYDSFNMAQISGDMNMTMGALMEPVKANIWFLLGSGIIMVLTLCISKKARRVTETEVNLARQDAGTERFGSTLLSRALVRTSLNISKYINHRTPPKVQKFIDSRFKINPAMLSPEAPSFDLIRATANLTIAAILIASATSLKLPLSTTYVTFMVAMGTSLADRAWGRESAVYRITGVLTVISGWFITALVAFTVAFLVAALLMWGHVYAIAALSVLCAYILFASNRGKKDPEETEQKQENLPVMIQCAKEISDSTRDIAGIFNNTLEGVFNEDRKILKQMSIEARALHKSASARKHSILPTLNMLKDNYIETGHYYVQVVDYLNEVAKALFHIAKSSYEHIDNNHEGFSASQLADLEEINIKMNVLFESVNTILSSGDFQNISEAKTLRDELFEYLTKAYKNQIRRDKNNQNTTRSSVLYYDILAEEKTIILQLRNLVNAQKYFVENNRSLS
jgi:phosphate/sulfate permease